MNDEVNIANISLGIVEEEKECKSNKIIIILFLFSKK